MAVTADRYELPIVVGGGAFVAKKLGIPVNAVYSRGRGSGKRRGYRIVKVREDEDAD
jgi:hypothetical protein